MPSEKAPIRNYVAYLLAEAHRKLHLQLEQSLKQEGVQVEHWRVLEILSDKRGRSMGELAELVLMNHPALTKMMDRMVADGLIHRALDPADHRRVIVFSTDRGQQLFERLKEKVDSHNSDVSAQLGAKNLKTLKKLLTDLVVEAS